MLFNSQLFLFGFLPVTLAVVLGLSFAGRGRLAKVALAVASLMFYGYWSVSALGLLVILIAFNYGAARLLLALRANPARQRLVYPVLVAGILANIGTLAFFKYASFTSQVLHDSGLGTTVLSVALPLGLSFITFQKIGFLVDVAGGVVEDFDFIDYCVFVSFFPQLIAGPIVHHRDIIPQVHRPGALRPDASMVAAGVTLLIVGLAKKVLVADFLALRARLLFDAAAGGETVGLLPAWCGAALYTLQLYFDFSGYCDMAVGLGLLFGVRLPLNFNSPFKAHDVVEFWQRWHMTLTRFLTSYLYNPLVLRATRKRAAAGLPPVSRNKMRPAAFLRLLAWPTLLTMFIAGVWHGAGFQFAVFGLLHGSFMVINHAWRLYRPRRLPVIPGPVSLVMTAAAVVFAFAFFRSPNLTVGLELARSMFGLNGLGASPELVKRGGMVVLGFLAVWTLPNSQQWIPGVVAPSSPQDDARPLPAHLSRWQPSLWWATGMAVLAGLAILQVTKSTEFLYFNF